MQGFLAYIQPIQAGGGGGGPVDPGFGVPGWPAHPIAPGGQPPGIWPSPGHPAHPIAPGGAPPWVSHPIPPTVWPNPPGAGPGNPPGFWGGTPPNWIDNTLPGQPPGIWGGAGGLPPWVMPPIVLPPGEKPPEEGSGNSPAHPIYIPGESGPGGVKQLVCVFVPGKGAVWFLVDVPTTGPHPEHPIVQPPAAAGPKK